VGGGVDESTLDLCPAEHVARVEHVQRDARIALHVLEPASVRAAIEQEVVICELEPHGIQLHAAIASGRPDGDRQRLVEERPEARTDLKGHGRLYTLKPTCLSTIASACRPRPSECGPS